MRQTRDRALDRLNQEGPVLFPGQRGRHRRPVEDASQRLVMWFMACVCLGTVTLATGVVLLHWAGVLR